MLSNGHRGFLTPEEQEAANALNRLDKRLEQMHWKHPVRFILLAAGLALLLSAIVLGIVNLLDRWGR